MSDCVFCKIVAQQIPATVVHEDEFTLAFMDIGQVNPGHVLVALKAHVENLYALDDAQAAAVARTSARVARAIRDALAPAAPGRRHGTHLASQESAARGARAIRSENQGKALTSRFQRCQGE
jgi:diadenosine tetraphosphate (Ap4A) HIT family hydrolase